MGMYLAQEYATVTVESTMSSDLRMIVLLGKGKAYEMM
jgi:hypothetical protein